MSLESLIENSGQLATITAEAADGQVPAQDALGGADRSDGNWVAVVDGVPCLLRTTSSALMAYGSGRNDARANVIDGRIYFVADPVPVSGISTRNRVTITQQGTGGQRTLGVWAVQEVTDPIPMGRIIQVDVERVRTP